MPRPCDYRFIEANGRFCGYLPLEVAAMQNRAAARNYPLETIEVTEDWHVRNIFDVRQSFIREAIIEEWTDILRERAA